VSPLRSRLLALLLAGVWSTTSGVAFADVARDRAAARSAAESGADAFDQGQYERALGLFTRAEELVHAPPHLLFMARSLTKLGRLVEAYEAYMKLVREQQPKNAPSAFVSAHAEAEREVSAVEARIAHVTVVVRGPEADKAIVTMDKTDLPAAVVGIPMPVDPGNHVFSAHTEQVKSKETTVTLRDGANESVALVLPAPPATATPPRSAAPASEAATQAESHPADRPAPDSGGISGQRIAGYITLGLGVAGTGVGTYFLISSLDKRGKANDLYECDATQSCSPAQVAEVGNLDDEADRSRNLAIASYAVGAAGIVTGLVLLLTDSSSTARPGAVRDVHLVAGLRSLAVAGRF
jgi:hypothetical protein